MCTTDTTHIAARADRSEGIQNLLKGSKRSARRPHLGEVMFESPASMPPSAYIAGKRQAGFSLTFVFK